MPRHGKPRRSQRTPAPLSAARRIDTGPDGYEYEVRAVGASRAVKIYRCPGCDHEIRTGTAHVVVWLAEAPDAAMADRRHWHTTCWAHRATRGPTRKWS